MGEPLRGMPGSTVGPVPIIRMFGVTQEVRSRCMGVLVMFVMYRAIGVAAARSADSPPAGMERGGMDPWLCSVFLLSCPFSLQCFRLRTLPRCAECTEEGSQCAVCASRSQCAAGSNEGAGDGTAWSLQRERADGGAHTQAIDHDVQRRCEVALLEGHDGGTEARPARPPSAGRE